MRREGRPGRRPTLEDWGRRPGETLPVRSATRARPLVYLRRVPIGELHAWGRCADCGTNEAPLRRSTHTATRAPAYLCEDICACLRRREVANRVV